jgi:hypothetical protein
LLNLSIRRKNGTGNRDSSPYPGGSCFTKPFEN